MDTYSTAIQLISKTSEDIEYMGARRVTQLFLIDGSTPEESGQILAALTDARRMIKCVADRHALQAVIVTLETVYKSRTTQEDFEKMKQVWKAISGEE